MTDKIEEVKKDIAELEKFQTEAIRQKVKDILTIEIRRLMSEVVKLEEQIKNTPCTSPITDENKIAPAPAIKSYQVKLNNYAWDQTQKYLKFYVTLAKVQTLPQENVICTWTNKSLELQIKGLENKDYIFTIKNLLYNIDPAQSSWKIKTDMIVISAAKINEEKWSHVTEYEKKASDSKKLVPDKPDENTDPGESLVNMMKKMYEQGDDEMKRIIAKAWTEGQQNKQMEL